MKLSTGGLAGLAGKTLTSTMLAALLLTTALIFNENELIDNPICNIMGGKPTSSKIVQLKCAVTNKCKNRTRKIVYRSILKLLE